LADLPFSFLFFSTVALTGAVNTVTHRNPVHAALWLVSALLGIAGLFLTLGSAFLASVQVLVYAGAIMVLFLFVVMLLNLEASMFEGLSSGRCASIVAGAATVALILFPLVEDDSLWTVPEPRFHAPASARTLSQLLFHEYVLPFEMVSLVLLVAMVGAIHLARRTRVSEGA